MVSASSAAFVETGGIPERLVPVGVDEPVRFGVEDVLVVALKFSTGGGVDIVGSFNTWELAKNFGTEEPFVPRVGVGAKLKTDCGGVVFCTGSFVDRGSAAPNGVPKEGTGGTTD